jgi:hypothetical protein
VITPATEIDGDTWNWSVPFPTFWIVNESVLLLLGEAGVAEAAPLASTPARKPTVTLTDAVTAEYVLPFASVKETDAVLVMTVPSGVWAWAGRVATAANITASVSVAADRRKVRSMIEIE